jgi:hypothetical protein
MRLSEVMSTPVRVAGFDQTASAAWEAMTLHRTPHLVVTGLGACRTGDHAARRERLRDR